jgi:hypothetical protein
VGAVARMRTSNFAAHSVGPCDEIVDAQADGNFDAAITQKRFRR